MDDRDLTGIGELQALLTQGVEFSGKLTFDGRVRIDGRFEGEIFSDGVLVLGPTAEVRGDISVATLIVRGAKVWGNVRAERLVELYAPAEIHADIASRQLYVDKGVVLDGKCITLEPAERTDGEPAQDGQSAQGDNETDDKAPEKAQGGDDENSAATETERSGDP